MPTPSEVVVEALRKTRAKTLEILHDTPAELLERKHPPSNRPIGSTLLHIVGGMDGWLTHVFKDGRDDEPAEEGPFDKLAMAKEMGRGLQRMLDWVSASPDRLTQQIGDPQGEHFIALDRIIYLIGHEVNHQTQITLALAAMGHDRDIFLPY
jgi:uncharacterized damage-inducible protein DinB